VAKLLGIVIKPKGSNELQLHNEAELSIDAGVVGDKRGKPGKRQVTLLSLVSWQQACDELGVDLHWRERRANLVVDDLPLVDTRGSQIVLGRAVLEITGETDPCSRMEKVHKGLFNALKNDWRGGVTCRVVKGGPVAVGMDVDLE